MSLLLLLGPRPASAATTILHPWLDSPAGWKTSVVVVNLGSTATAVRLLAYDTAGTFLGEVPGGMTLAPGERGSYATASTLPVGTAGLSVQADSPFASVILLEATDGSAQDVLLPASAPALDFLLPVLSGSAPWTSQLRLVNAGTAATAPTVVARDATGRVLGTKALPTLAPLASTTVDLRTLFTATVLTTAATLQVTAAQPLTALQLVGATDRPDVAALPGPLNQGTQLLLPVVTQGPNSALWTLAGVLNPQAVSVTVTAEALDAQGRSLGILPELTSLPARGSHVFRTPDLGGTLPVGTAALQLTGAQPLSGYALVGGAPTAGVTALVALGPADAPAGYDLVGPPAEPVLTAAPWWSGAAGQSLPALGDTGAGTWTQQLSAPTSGATGSSATTSLMAAAAAAPATGQLTLTWADAANDFTGFKIERKTGTTGTYALLTTLGAVFTYTDSGLPVGTTYCYRVKATNAAGDSPPSNEACGTVATPIALTVTMSGPGTVTSSPGGISCGTTCSANFTSGTRVTLTATGGTGSSFTGWSGACTGTGSCVVSMTVAQSVTASFTVVPPPGAATLVSPTGTLTTRTPTFMWNTVASAAQYGLEITDSTGVKPLAWYTPAQAGCSAGTGTCSVASPLTLASGAGKWRILTWSSGGYGPYSAALSFTVSLATPAKVTLVSPTGTITTATPTFTWNAVGNVGQYGLQVKNASSGATVLTWVWYTPAQAGCSAGTGTCSVAAPLTLAAGSYQWQILPWNSAGYGPASDAMAFTASFAATPRPAAATLISPSGTITTATPSYRWNAVPGAAQYGLQITDSTGVKPLQWYWPAQAGCASGTGTCTVPAPAALATGAGQWRVLTWNSTGYGPYSAALTFTVSLPTPAAAALVSPTGSLTTRTPTFTWNAVPGAAQYGLEITDSTGVKPIQWYWTTQASCGSGTGTCSVAAPLTLASGAGQWRVITWSSAGYGPWSAALSFTVSRFAR